MPDEELPLPSPYVPSAMDPTNLFVEPPEEPWFLMRDDLPPPTHLLALAAYVEREMPEVHTELIDSQAEHLIHATL